MTIYKHPVDVDPFLGGILENHVASGALRPIFGCLVAEQFKRLCISDWFSYQKKNEVGFNKDQLQELRKVSLARLLCDNINDIKEIPERVLSAKSLPVSCESLPSMDLTNWKVK